MVKAASWNTALLLATYEYPVSWLDPHTSAVTGLAIELICPPLIALGLFTRRCGDTAPHPVAGDSVRL